MFKWYTVLPAAFAASENGTSLRIGEEGIDTAFDEMFGI
jgi:hypothetical protein